MAISVPVIHDVGGYAIIKPKSSINMPTDMKASRFCMRVCPQHNSSHGCFIDFCVRFHVCYRWIMGRCFKSYCKYGHTFDSDHNICLMTPLLSGRELPPAELVNTLRSNSNRNKIPVENCDMICLRNLFTDCRDEHCRFIHIGDTFSWGLTLEDEFRALPMNEEIEEWFCSPSCKNISVSFEREMENFEYFMDLLQYSTWDVNFEEMKFSNRHISYQLTRLSTIPDVASHSCASTRWFWYWEDDNGLWHNYTHATVDNFFIIPFNDYLEKKYLIQIRFIFCLIGQFVYKIDFESMLQENIDTKKRRNITRRPNPKQWKMNETYDTFHSIWQQMPQNRRLLRVVVSSASTEMKMILGMIRRTLPSAKIRRLERIQNTYLWNVYQLKKDEMRSALGGINHLKEQYMFHGTVFSAVGQICHENFDWRRHGSRTGNRYGRGTYFSNKAIYADKFAETSNKGLKCMFVAFVLVGFATLGDADTILPRINPHTNDHFDSTVDSADDPCIFVKYNFDEYYPAYFLKYTTQ